jgi:hypothetical protein
MLYRALRLLNFQATELPHCRCPRLQVFHATELAWLQKPLFFGAGYRTTTLQMSQPTYSQDRKLPCYRTSILHNSKATELPLYGTPRLQNSHDTELPGY